MRRYLSTTEEVQVIASDFGVAATYPVNLARRLGLPIRPISYAHLHTPTSNQKRQATRIAKGTTRSPELIAEIVALKGTMSSRQIAQRFGLSSHQVVKNIWHKHRHLTATSEDKANAR